MPLRIGTRRSPLARWQAEWVAARLRETGAAEPVLVEITTAGDEQQMVPVARVGGRGVFTKAIQQALLDGRADIAVHSLKDLPTEPVEGLMLGAVPKRESPHDVLIAREAKSLDDLPPGAVIGTGSLRRQAQLLHLRRDLVMHDIRGNVDTRVRKLDEGQYDAIVLAEAGLRRLGLESCIAQVLDEAIMLPAAGQGALAIECRAEDDPTRAVLAPLEDAATRAAVEAERSLLAALRGGCLAPIGALGRMVADDVLRLAAAVLSADGSRRLHAAIDGDPRQAVDLGRKAAEQLLAGGAAELIGHSRDATD